MDQQDRYSEADLMRIGARWMDRIRAAEKREEDWTKVAKQAEATYLCDDSESAEAGTRDFNILHSNIETIVPAIYNSTPSPDIRPRHRNDDPAAKTLADALERAISTQIDDDRLTREIEALAQDASLAGRGVTRIRFMAEFTDAGMRQERVVYENVSWRDYREGPAKRWDAVPWVAYRHRISEEELNRITDPDIAAAYDKPFEAEAEMTEDLDVTVWECWCRETSSVYFVIEDTGRVARITDDPMGLSGFFPQPQPVQPLTGTGRRTPVCPFAAYRQLAEELDLATRRINAITRGLRVRGGIAGNPENVEMLAQADDNELIALPDLESLAATGGLSNAIVWWPVDTAIAVLAQLYQQREQTKQAIYEITGLADIIRGASDPRETATAQELKGQWGSQRVKRMQRMIQSHVRDLFVLTAEVMAKHFSPEGIQRAAGMAIPPEVLAMLGQGMDSYRIDVETDSTIRADMHRTRRDMTEFIQGSAGFFQVMAPIIEQTPAAAVPAAELYASYARTYNLGKSAEDAIDTMTQQAVEQAKQGQQANPEDQKNQAEIQLQQYELQIKQQEAQARGMEAQARIRTAEQKAQIDQQKVQAEALKARIELAIEQQKLGLEVNRAQLEREIAQFDAMMKREELKLEQQQARPVALGVA